MKLSSPKLMAVLLTGLILVALAASPVSVRPQNPKADIKSDPVEAQVDPTSIRVNKRAPIPFKKLDTIDPNTGKQVPPDTIVTFKGKSITAGELNVKMNQLEEQLNLLGATQRRAGTVQLQVTALPAALPKQAQALRAAQIPNSTFRSIDLPTAEQEQRTMIAAPRLNVPDTILNSPVTPLHVTKNWDESLGNPKTFSAFIKGHITLDGAKDLTTIEGEASAGGSMFNHSVDLLRVTSNLRAPRTGPMNAKVAVRIAGISVFNLNENVNASFSKTGSLQKTLDKSVSIHFAIGPIPVSAKVGVQGAAGVSYAVSVAPIRANAQFGPFVHTNVYAQAGVGLFFVEAGARATLTLLNTDGHLKGAISIEGADFKWSDSYCQSVDMLSGKVSFFVTINYLFDSSTYNWDVFSFNGFKANGCLFKEAKTRRSNQQVHSL